MHLLFCVAGAHLSTSSQSKLPTTQEIKKEPVETAPCIKEESKSTIDLNNNRIKYSYGRIKLESKDDVKILRITGPFLHSEQPDIKPKITTIESPPSDSMCNEEVSELSDDQLPVTRLDLNLETCEGVRVVYESQHSLLLSKMYYLKDLINFRGDHKTQCTRKQAELIQEIISQFSGISSVSSSTPLYALIKEQGIVDIDTITSGKQTTDNSVTGNQATNNLATRSQASSEIVSMDKRQDSAGSEDGPCELTSELEVKGKGHRKRKVNFGCQTHEKARKLQLPGIGVHTVFSDTETILGDSELTDGT